MCLGIYNNKNQCIGSFCHGKQKQDTGVYVGLIYSAKIQVNKSNCDKITQVIRSTCDKVTQAFR